MSIEAMKAVWRHSETTGNARMVLTLIANNANAEGWDSYPKQSTLAHDARIGQRTVEKCIAAAVDLGELEVHRPDRSKQNRYSIMLPGLAIHDDDSERERRDRAYENMRLGRAEATRIRRQTRRSEDPNVHAGPRTSDPNEHSGGTRTSIRVGPERTDGSDPNVHAGPLKEETPKPLETPLKHQRAREVDKIVDLMVRDYPEPIEDTMAVRLAAEERVLAGATADEVAALLGAWVPSENWREESGRYVPRPEKFLRDRRYHRGPGGKPVEQLLAKSAPAASEVISAGDWRDVGAAFAAHVGGSAVLGPVTPVGVSDTELLLTTDKRTADWIDLRYARPLADAAAQVLAKPITAIRFVEPPAQQGVAA